MWPILRYFPDIHNLSEHSKEESLQQFLPSVLCFPYGSLIVCFYNQDV